MTVEISTWMFFVATVCTVCTLYFHFGKSFTTDWQVVVQTALEDFRSSPIVHVFMWFNLWMVFIGYQLLVLNVFCALFF